jgi:cytidylate kinase
VERIVITIDGPAGAGKSSAARALAERLGYTLLDTGAIYRAVALLAIERGVATEEALALAQLAAGLDVRFRFEGEKNHVLIGDRDVTAEIRRPDVAQGASRVSALPEVRAALLDLQRALGARGGVVVEGRDTGTVVFPDAALKIFLTASPEERAHRRHAEEQARGLTTDLERTQREMEERDRRDAGRTVAPLRPAADAVLFDTTGVPLAEVVDRLVERARAAGA